MCGELNIKMLKSNSLICISYVHGCHNCVTKSTYFKSKVATLIDVAITNVSESLQHIACIDCDLSNFHHMVWFATKMHKPIFNKWHIIYRSYKHFSEQTYIQDLSYNPFRVCEIFEGVSCNEIKLLNYSTRSSNWKQQSKISTNYFYL